MPDIDGATPDSGATPGTPQQTPPPATGNGAGQDDANEPLRAEGLRALARERELREAAERKLREREDRDKTAEQRNQEELDRLKAENAALAAARREDGVRLATSEIGRRLGFRNPEIAHRFINVADVEFDAAGNPKPGTIESQLKAVIATETYLVNGAAGQPNYGAGPQGKPPATTEQMNDWIRRQARGG